MQNNEFTQTASEYPKDREAARAAGLKYFCSGVPCRRGHISKRYVSSYTCYACKKSEEGLARRRELRSRYREHDTPASRAAKAKWADANKEKILAKSRAYYAANKEKHTKLTMRWRAANKAAAAAIRHRRRALKAASGGTHTAKDIAAIFVAQRGKCAYCRIKVGKKYHVDHVMPLSRGGSNAASNLQITCGACNTRKNDLLPWDFARRMGMLI